ncbi:MAG: hypothetical protein MJ252_26425 [archaeon]|nr:hypothetical protein [archaeon]
MESLVYDHTTNQEIVLESYYCQILKDKNSFLFYTGQKSELKNFTKKFLMCVIEFSLFMDLGNVIISINRKSPEADKIYRSLITTGFKNCDEINNDPDHFRMITTSIQKRERNEPLEEVPVFGNH